MEKNYKKIFIVVGSQIPFDRLVSAVDNWAEHAEDIEIVGQIGRSKYKPRNFMYYSKLSAPEFNQRFDNSDLIIGHAGMGIILKSLTEGKPIIAMPRLVKLNECTTNHQVATSNALKKLNYIHVAMDTSELLRFLNDLSSINVKHTITEFASTQLINTISDFISNINK